MARASGRRRRLPLRIISVAVAGCVALLAVFHRPIVLHLNALQGYIAFKENHRPEREFAILIHESDWATSFSGKSGLHYVKRLETDSSISESGRLTATEIRESIESGRHTEYLKSTIDSNTLNPIGMTLVKWIYAVDRD